METNIPLHKENFFDRYTGTISIESVCENVIWLIRLRWIACVGLLFGVIMSKAFFKISGDTVYPILMIGILILFFNFIFYLRYSFLSKRKGQSKECVETPILFFFIFHMVISSIMLSRVNAFFWAFFTIIIQSLMTYLEYIGKLEHKNFFYFIHELKDRSGYSEFFILIIFSITLIITVYFATTIMRPIRKKQLDLTILKNELLEQKKLLELKNIELEEIDKSKTNFLYRVEHELKAPIGAILSMLSVVVRGYNSVDDNKKIDFLNRSMIRIKGMKDMVVDLLSLSRIEAKNFRLNKTDIDISTLTEKMITELTPYSQKKKIGIKTHIDKNIPLLKADSDALTEIIRNLIHNAIKYSFEGVVTVSLLSDKKNIILSIKDTGIGISEDDLNNIFEEFYRTSNAKAFEEGTGLGLSLVKKLIEQHNGNIEIKSEINKGTESIVSFPL